jgi:hypothetical protein
VSEPHEDARLSDSELRKKLREVFIKHKRYMDTDFIDAIMQLLAQAQEEAERAARLDETNKWALAIVTVKSPLELPEFLYNYHQERVAQLHPKESEKSEA